MALEHLVDILGPELLLVIEDLLELFRGEVTPRGVDRLHELFDADLAVLVQVLSERAGEYLVDDVGGQLVLLFGE